MPRIVVASEEPSPKVLLEEEVKAVHMADEHSLWQILERVTWAVMDAHEREVMATARA